jgi:hypothetical protein
VPELGGGGGFPAEALLEGLVTRELGLEDLDRDRDVELRVLAAIDPGESSRADDVVDAEAPQVGAEVALRQRWEPLQG